MTDYNPGTEREVSHNIRRRPQTANVRRRRGDSTTVEMREVDATLENEPFLFKLLLLLNDAFRV